MKVHKVGRVGQKQGYQILWHLARCHRVCTHQGRSNQVYPMPRSIGGKPKSGRNFGHKNANPAATPLHSKGKFKHLHGIAAMSKHKAIVRNIYGGAIHVPSVQMLSLF
jgi:hypothetical protein